MVKGADGVPIFTNVPTLTRGELATSGGILKPNADQSLTFPGVSNLVRDQSGTYTGGTIGVAGSNTGQPLTRALPSAVAGGQPDATRSQMPGSPLPGPDTPSAETGSPAAYGSIASRYSPNLTRLPQESAPAPAGYDPTDDIAAAQLDRQSDLASILNKDPRSVAGTAARNAEIDANSYASRIGHPGARVHTVADPNAARQSLLDSANSNFEARTKAALDRSKDLGETGREAMRNSTTLAGDQIRAGAEFNKPSYQTDASGNQLVFTGARSQPVLGQDGQPVKSLLKNEDAGQKRSDMTMDALAKTAAGQLANIVPPGKVATQEQIAQARMSAAKVHGLRTASAEGKPPLVEVSPGKWVSL